MKKTVVIAFFLISICSLKAQVKDMKTALVLIDIQNDYFKDGKMELYNPEKAGDNAKILLNAFRKNNMPVIHIQHLSTRAGSTFFIPKTLGAEINERVKPLNNEKIIIKHYPNSFRETNLWDYLKSMDIEKLVICGMMTHMCVDATVRAAKDYGFECLVVGDACATKNLEINHETVKASDVQKAFLSALNYFYASVVTTEQFLKQ
ncbi:nicotinamidase-related amidase [Ancylomarina subtilis]|uniref:Nicotinamidase-related amidase n=1 Tax=Ancylomarina subtilis TaxID=1639035 RepID=A0A4Q7VJ05_9BACT|nr:cysteine hydrolase family protein [Ancylomarina subtilis]RZT96156.1 nicotinamidase-related amidase [Ancylomarina subtilis]